MIGLDGVKIHSKEICSVFHESIILSEKFRNPETVSWDLSSKQSQEFWLSQSSHIGHKSLELLRLGQKSLEFFALRLKSHEQKSFGLVVPSHAHPCYESFTEILSEKSFVERNSIFFKISKVPVFYVIEVRH